MADRTKYGWCPMLKMWVPRDDMLAVNVKAFDEKNNEERIRIRVSPAGYEKLVEYLRSVAWTGVLREEQELFSGLTDERREDLRRGAARTSDYEASETLESVDGAC